MRSLSFTALALAAALSIPILGVSAVSTASAAGMITGTHPVVVATPTPPPKTNVRIFSVGVVSGFKPVASPTPPANTNVHLFSGMISGGHGAFPALPTPVPPTHNVKKF